jgi:hypothetical protein
MNVACAYAKSFSYQIGVRIYAQEQDSCGGSDGTDTPGYVQPIAVGQADIQENQVRLAAPGFPKGFQSIGSLPDDAKLRSLQDRANAFPEARKVIDH